MGGLSHTVSGDIASFRTPSRVPIESLKFHFLPKQEGSGDPSPTNICPITGWTGMNGRRAGKNLIEPHYGVETVQRDLTITPSTNGISVSGTASARTAVLLSKANKNTKLEVGGKVTFSLYLNGDISECELPFLGYYKSPGVWGAVIGQLSSNNNQKITWTVPNTYTDDSILDSYIYVPQGVTVNFEIGLQMEEGSSATAYEPYSEELIPITFPVAGTNKVDPSTIVPETRISVSDGVYSNTGTDTRTFVQLSVQLWKTTGTYIKTVATLNNITTTGRKALTFDVDTEDCHYIAFKHNGIVADFRVLMPFTLGLGTYTLSVDLLSADPTTVGGFRFKDVQLEVGETATAYEPYSSDNAFYGGYIDPVAGEIVSEYKIDVYDGVNKRAVMNFKTTDRYYALIRESLCQSGTEGHVISNMLKTQYSHGENTCYQRPSDNGYLMDFGRTTICNLSLEDYDALSNSEQTALVNSYLSNLYQNGTPLVIVYKLADPIHIPIPAQDLKAFLDHNNFWSDANDITEVTYPVTESKDILATRKKAMAFNHAHHKKVKWNQICKYGDFQNAKDWLATSGYGSLSVDNGIMTWTALQVPTQYYQTGFSHSKIYIEVPYNHKVLAMAKVKTSCSGANLQARLYGMVGSNGGANTYSYNTYISRNDWIDVKGFIRDRPENPPTGIDDTIIKKFKILLALANGGSYEGIIDIGSTLQAKNFMVFDLTQMFGLGNEPQTVAEFERICAINSIDLTTYQPYDTGSDRWLIIP